MTLARAPLLELLVLFITSLLPLCLAGMGVDTCMCVCAVMCVGLHVERRSHLQALSLSPRACQVL